MSDGRTFSTAATFAGTAGRNSEAIGARQLPTMAADAPPLPLRYRQCFGRHLAKLRAVAAREVTEMPEAVGQGDVLDGLRSTEETLPHQPQSAQAQIAMQAHAAITLHHVIHRAYRDADAVCEFVAVDATANLLGQRRLDVPEYLELPTGVGVTRPPRRNDIGNRTVDGSEQGFAHRDRRL